MDYERLRQLIKGAGGTVAVAREMGVSRVTVFRWCSPKYNDPSTRDTRFIEMLAERNQEETNDDQHG